MKIRYSVDRAEGDILVLISDSDSSVLELDRSLYPYSVNDVLDVELGEDGNILSVTNCTDEREERLQKNKSRLEALFKRGKK